MTYASWIDQELSAVLGNDHAVMEEEEIDRIVSERRAALFAVAAAKTRARTFKACRSRRMATLFGGNFGMSEHG